MKALLSQDNHNQNKTKDRPNPQSGSLADDDLQFTFFSTDDGEIDVGIGINIDPNRNFGQTRQTEARSVQPDPVEPKTNEESAPTEENTALDVPAAVMTEDAVDQIPPQGLRIFGDEEVTLELFVQDNIVEKSEKLFAETRSAMETREINVDIERLKTPEPAGALHIEADVELDPLNINIEKLEEEYRDQSTPVKQSFIEVDKVTAADRAGKAVNWTTQTFIVSPTKGLFKALHNGIINLFGFIGNILKFLLISAVATVGIYIVMAHYSDSGLSAYEMATQHYEIAKEIVVTFYEDISSEVRGIKGQ